MHRKKLLPSLAGRRRGGCLVHERHRRSPRGVAAGGAGVNITLWHGYEAPAPGGPPNFEAISLKTLIDQFNATHPSIHVEDVFCCSNDFALQKLTVALQGDEQPDIAYEYGSSMPQLATTPKVVDLTQRVNDPAYGWNDFFPGERAVTTVDGKVLGVPALVDNLAIVYNQDAVRRPASPLRRRLDLGRLPAPRLRRSPTRRKKQYGWASPTTRARTRSGTTTRCSGRRAGTS